MSASAVCPHLKSLPKSKIVQLLTNPPQLICNSHPKAKSSLSICLHCENAFCGECLKQHSSSTAHSFLMEMTEFRLQCMSCARLIEEMVDLNGQAANEDCLRMRRFLNFMKETWISLRQHYFPTQITVRGIVNLNNTCYLASILQCIVACPSLKNLYRSENFFTENGSRKMRVNKKWISKQIEIFYDEISEGVQEWIVVGSKAKRREGNSKASKEVKDASLNYILYQTMRQLEQNLQEPYSPVNLLDYLSHLSEKYRPSLQQDAEELLLFLLSSLSIGERLTLFSKDDQERYAKVQQALGAQKISLIENCVGAYLGNEIICKDCGNVRVVMDMVYSLDLEIQSKNQPNPIQRTQKEKIAAQQAWQSIKYQHQLSLPQQKIPISPLLSHFFRREELTHYHNDFICPSCPSKNGHHQYFLVSLPSVLILSLKRFNRKGGKIQNYVPFDETINLSSITLRNKEEQNNKNSMGYRLNAVVVHEGRSAIEGHYYSYIKKEGKWFKCNDKRVTLASWSETKSCQAYLLFYEQIPI